MLKHYVHVIEELRTNDPLPTNQKYKNIYETDHLRLPENLDIVKS